ncbi:MAG: class I SAM-dependent methyltransferase [Ginsengibacter sp.]
MNQRSMMEKFQPVSNTPPVGFWGRLKFFGRMIPDLQIKTIYKDVKQALPTFTGNVLDVGCGQSPYRFLLSQKETTYFGIDIKDADKFKYFNADIIEFNGEDIPFESEKFNAVICTEVLEHVFHFQKLIDEMYRVCKANADLIVTIPWSARYHYIPWDFFRYTPASLTKMFSNFKEVTIKPRGTDLTSMCAKFIVLYYRNIIPKKLINFLFLPFWICLLPVFILVVLVAHLSIFLNLGSSEDPLGYTIFLKK